MGHIALSSGINRLSFMELEKISCLLSKMEIKWMYLDGQEKVTSFNGEKRELLVLVVGSREEDLGYICRMTFIKGVVLLALHLIMIY